MAKASRTTASAARLRQVASAKAPARAAAAKPKAMSRTTPETARAGWATNLVFDVREPKLAVSLRLDADVLRFFRGFGAGYQTRINEVLKAFMQARGEPESIGQVVAGARATRAVSNGKRAR